MWQTLFYCCPLFESSWQTQCKNNMVYARRTVKENHRPLQNADVLFCTKICTTHNDMMTWWRHQMETFSALLALCAGSSPVSGEFPSQGPVSWSFDAFFDLRLNKRLSKQSWCWWFGTLSCPLWRHCNKKANYLSLALNVVKQNNQIKQPAENTTR